MRWIAICLLWLLGALNDLHAADAAIDAFGRLPAIDHMALSPDGLRIAYVRSTATGSTLFAVGVDDHKLLASVPVGDAKVRTLEWADGRHVLIVSTVNGSILEGANAAEFGFLRVLDADSGKLDDPMSRQHLVQFIAGEPVVRRSGTETVLLVRGISLVGGYARGAAMLRMELNSGVVRSEDLDLNDGGFVFDESGALLATQYYDGVSKRWHFKLRMNGRLQQVAAGVEAIDVPRIAGLSPDGSSLWIRFNDQQQVTYRPLSLTDGKLGEPLESLRGLRLQFDPRGERATGVVLDEMRTQVHFFDARREQVWQAAVNSLPDARVTFIGAADDFSRLLVEVEPAGSGPQFVLLDAVSHEGQVLGLRYDGLPPLGEVRLIVYPATDGLQIPSWLTLPRDVPARNLPLIVMPHGGPQAHDSEEFDWWSQALAAQGYAVLRPNFRGSDLTPALLTAGFGEWGRKMQTDLSDGVAMLVRAGLVDASRVCIIGASYGGYAALAGVSMQKGVYRCAVSVAGVADLPLQIGTGRSFSANNRYFDRYLGVTNRQADVLRELSPMEHAADVSVPVLLIHGRNDAVVHYVQSENMYKALRRRDKPVQMVTLDREDHWLSRSDTRLQMLEASIRFLRANNPPD